MSLALAIAIYTCLGARRHGWALLLALALPLYLTLASSEHRELLGLGVEQHAPLRGQ